MYECSYMQREAPPHDTTEERFSKNAHADMLFDCQSNRISNSSISKRNKQLPISCGARMLKSSTAVDIVDRCGLLPWLSSSLVVWYPTGL